jgi:hypothetical protein
MTWIQLRFANRSLLIGVALLAGGSAARAAELPSGAPRTTLARRGEIVPGIRLDHAVMPASLAAALAAVPSFSRQTGLACSMCHNQFPQLTPFGRLFKLNGYTMTGLQAIGRPGDSTGHESLKLSPIPPLSAMVVASVTLMNSALPGTQNGTTQLPQQLSLFAAGAISPKMGAFTQFTYTPDAGTFGIDNIDVRYATHTTLGTRDVLFGLTLHNNPTVQDVWNTVPAWGFPFMSSAVAPSPIASTLIDGALAQQVVGLGAYSMFDNLVYGELTAYRSAPQGAAQPLDTGSSNVARGVIPYWRLALQHAGQSTYFMLGTYGLTAHLYPTGVSGATNYYRDIAIDAQLEQKAGNATWIGRASWIHESQQLEAFAFAPEPAAEGVNESLSTLRASLSWQPSFRYGLTGGYFRTTGTSDTLRFAPATLVGSRTGSPNSAGAIGEFDFNAWQNVRLALQYVAWSRFNGETTEYDVLRGRRAADNNTLYLSTWLAF